VSAVLTAQEPSAKYLVNLQPPLVRHFDLIAQAPGGVARLRELILTLAVQGKLVPQDPSDEPASELLKKIALEKDRLVAEKKIRKGKPLLDIGDEEMFFELPGSWAWVRLNSIGDWGAGATPSRTNSNYYGGKIPWFKSGELTADHIAEPEETVTEAALRECSLRLNQPGDVLIAMYGATIGKTAILDVVGTTNQAVCACTPFSGMLNSYLLLLMKALKPYFISQGAGGAQPNISREKIIHTVIGLPPLAEQSRIVTRVEELMQLCDALEASGQLEAQHHAQLVGTLLGTLTQSETPEALADNWQRIATHFDVLLDRPEAVDALEQTILQLAVRGLLVPQDPTDEPASVLLQKIRTEKDHLIAQGKIKRDKPLPPITDEEKPFELPQGWSFARISELVEMLNGYAFKSEWFKPTGTRLLRNLNISHGYVDWSQPACIDTNAANEFSQFDLKVGDVVLSLDRPIISTGLKYAVIQQADLPCLLLQRVARLTPHPIAMSLEFLELWLQSDLFVGTIDPGRSNGVPHISTKQVGELIVGLPPMTEQSRIVTRVNELRSLCADLRRQIVKARVVVANLSKSLVAEV
jgi:type I restriction enzyme S subunit